MNVICLGLSHRTAAVNLREKFAVADADLISAATRLGQIDGIQETVIVSTCNRVEFYAAAEKPERGFVGLHKFLEARAHEHSYDPDIFYKFDSPDSIRHLFRVVSGLDSMVLGETEILGQVKKAYSTAVSGGTTSRHLNKLFQRAFNVAKEVRTQTNITRGPVSVGSAAVDLAEKIFGHLGKCKVMILGAGETSEMTARALYSRGITSILVSNRTYERAHTLATELNGQAIHFEQWGDHVHDVDIIISSTAAQSPILTREKVSRIMGKRGDRPLFVIDLAVPRDVEAAVNEIEGVYLYDIDSLQAIAQRSMEIRLQDLTRCESMIERHVLDFNQWLARAHLPHQVQAAIAANSFERIMSLKAAESRSVGVAKETKSGKG